MTHYPPPVHQVRVIVRSQDGFLCVSAKRPSYTFAHSGSTLDCSGLEFPGGKVDFGFNPKDDGPYLTPTTIARAGARELYEETGLRAASLQVLLFNEPWLSAYGRYTKDKNYNSVVLVRTLHSSDTGYNTPFNKEPEKAFYVGYLQPENLLQSLRNGSGSFEGHFDHLMTDFVDPDTLCAKYPLPPGTVIPLALEESRNGDILSSLLPFNNIPFYLFPRYLYNQYD